MRVIRRATEEEWDRIIAINLRVFGDGASMCSDRLV